MKKRPAWLRLAVALLALFALWSFGSCDTVLGSDDDDDNGGAADGTATVSLSGASEVDGEHLWVWLYAGDEWNIDSPETVLAAGSQEISGGTASFVLKESDENWGYTSDEWSGTGGNSYDLYIMTAPEDGEPTETSKIAAEYPLEVTIDGNESVEVAYSTMAAYEPTTGTLTVTLEGAEEQNGELLTVGVWPKGDHPAEDEPLAHGSTAIDSGTATVSIEPWDSPAQEAGTEYGVFIFITLEDRGDNGPAPGTDYVYKTHTDPVPWYVYGDRTMLPHYDDFVIIPEQ